MSTKKNAEHVDIYNRITNQIIEALENCKSWKCPWHSPEMVNVIPKNAKTGAQYRGVNALALWATAEKLGHLNGLWATFRQWQELGAQVRKGEKSCPVVFWSTIDKKENARKEGQAAAGDTADDRDTILFAKTYHVFNISQVDGYEEPLKKPLAANRLENADHFFSRLGVNIREASKAFYQPSDDSVYMPPFSSFFNREGYYSTLAHEVTHWTGHETRLNRDLKNRFGDESYAMEELIAELGAAFLCAELEISNEPREDHAAYIQSWLEAFKEDKRAIFTAASKAQQSTDWLRRAADPIHNIA